MASSEAELSRQIRDDLRTIYKDIHVYLIQDARRSGRKPYDFYYSVPEGFCAVELKLIKNWNKSVSFDIVTPHQLQSLKEVIYNSEQKGLIGIGLQETRQCLLIAPADWEDIKNHYKGKSVKLKQLFEDNPERKWFTVMERIKHNKKTIWDVKMLREL